ncbi:MAG TPA: hypothetical protein PKM65_04045 [Spirochaetota bacterium]|nr:hypothetical protein [Spirochaetota bacterium]HNT10746.1 hypothetical protein [Spirochaetota bacterium]HNV47497.1 hypothetical protein [Spirochaetota bacterium]HOS40410.1 hypothetical protein [Spirochaetota bacterium]HPU88779.1 hypothetical protein [Spirochaetota bacterium]
MKRTCMLIAAIALLATAVSCKKAPSTEEPSAILNNWAAAIKDLKYDGYRKYEAYPRDEAVFAEMFRNNYFMDVMVNEVSEVDEKDVRKDQHGNRFIRKYVNFEATSVKRATAKPDQLLRGDVVLIKFLDGKRAGDGWLISNRTMMYINR